MKVSIDKRNDDDILYQGSIIEFEFDDKWYYVYRPGVSTSIIPLLELTKDEDEMFDYLKDISEFGHENPHN